MTPEQTGLLIAKYSEVGKRTQCLVAQLTASTKSLSELVSRQGLKSKIIRANVSVSVTPMPGVISL